VIDEDSGRFQELSRGERRLAPRSACPGGDGPRQYNSLQALPGFFGDRRSLQHSSAEPVIRV